MKNIRHYPGLNMNRISPDNIIVFSQNKLTKVFMTKTRLEAFSDAVIAIVITIMVLEMKIPHEATLHALANLWEVFLSYALSFLMLSIYWGNHHHLIHTLKEVSSGIMWANLHLLFWLSLIPFATGWMGENEFESMPVAVYAILSLCCGLAYYVLLMIIKSSNQHNQALLEVLGKQIRKGRLSCILYTLAIPVAYISSISGLGILFLVAFFWIIPDRNIEKSLKS